MDENGYFPVFEEGDDGQYYVHWRGQRWGLLTPLEPSYETEQFGLYERRALKVNLSFSMCLLPPEQPRKPERTYARAMGLRKPQ